MRRETSNICRTYDIRVLSRSYELKSRNNKKNMTYVQDNIYTDSRLTFGQCWTNCIGYIRPILVNDVGPMKFAHLPIVGPKCWVNVGTMSSSDIDQRCPNIGQMYFTSSQCWPSVGLMLAQCWVNKQTKLNKLLKQIMNNAQTIINILRLK